MANLMELQLGTVVSHWHDAGDGVALSTQQGQPMAGHLLLGCDGVWSRLRQQLLNDGPPHPTGHLAYRGLAPAVALPAALRGAEVTAWLGERMHLVS